MVPAHDATPRHRSAFVAAFLSLLFPGLGHVYLGAFRRGLGFAAPPLLIGALTLGFVVRMSVTDLAGMAVQTWFLTGLFIVNLVALAYRAAAIVDAWMIAKAIGPAPARSGSQYAGAISGFSIAGLAAVVLVMSGLHVVVARYDVLLAGTEACVFDASAAGCGSPDSSSGPTGSPEPSTSLGPDVAGQTLPPWNGKDRLNILLLGADEQAGAHNTDTMITVSIDPTTGQVVMFTLPRDTVDVPVPPGPARNLFGATYQGKINSWFTAIKNHPDFFAGTDATRGYTGLKAILSNLYGIDIRYYVEVNFTGFQKVVDALGGVTINVEVPVIDDHFPLSNDHQDRLYIPAGPQHMTGVQALQYARSRHESSDFDRGARQQRLLVALRQETDVSKLLPSIDTLTTALKQSVRTDIPRELVPQLLSLAQKADTKSIRSVIFTPPFYQTENSSGPRGYIIIPKIDRIRAAVQDAFTVDPGFAEARDAIAEEGGALWVLNGSGLIGEASKLAAYLNYLGMDATAPTQRPDTKGLTATTIRVYNGSEDRLPLTIAALKQVFGVEAVLVTDPSVHVDIVIITARSTPLLTPPPAP